jgi:hypothetical protein
MVSRIRFQKIRSGIFDVRQGQAVKGALWV